MKPKTLSISRTIHLLNLPPGKLQTMVRDKTLRIAAPGRIDIDSVIACAPHLRATLRPAREIIPPSDPGSIHSKKAMGNKHIRLGRPSRDNITRAALVKLIVEERWTIQAVADQFNVPKHTIKNRMAKYGIRVPRTEEPTRATLEQLYIRDGLTAREIASRFAVSEAMVYGRLHKHRIKARDKRKDPA